LGWLKEDECLGGVQLLILKQGRTRWNSGRRDRLFRKGVDGSTYNEALPMSIGSVPEQVIVTRYRRAFHRTKESRKLSYLHG